MSSPLPPPPGPPAGAHAAPPAAAVAAHPAADLERRFTAYAVDRLLGWGVAAAVAYAVRELLVTSVWTAVGTFVGVAVLLGLVSAVLLGTTGLTPGKAMTGLRVVRQRDGRPIGVGAALGRVLVLGVAGLPTLCLGVATLGWTAAMDPTRRRRGLHDRIGDAVVVDVRPRPVEDEEDERPQQLVNLTAMRLLPSPPPRERSTDAPTHPPQAPPAPPAPAPAAPAPPPAHPQSAPPQSAPPQPAAAPAPTGPQPPAPPGRGAKPTPATATAAPAAAAANAPTHVRPRPTAPAGAARWRVRFDTGEDFVVEGLALVGRRPEPRPGEPVRHVVPLRSDDMSLSKTHAQFQVAPDGALVVMDRGSTNGSYVVRKGVTKTLSPGRPSTLLEGDVVRFGDRTMHVARVD